ncbi:hypothetical protein HYC85_028812 [Camellia sinensis]|uniref:Uncharacterized protein n=1 Tax=Camellia sinensis TaxID=4442 RepID=A0A7J7FXD8_CAMSI|nr:hypothetical protein HYC85_028812 [Camellia sinensis]
MVRLTADLIWKSPHLFNGIRERELDLRGNKIAVIENWGGNERLLFFCNYWGRECLEQIEAQNLFSSQEAEEQAKKESAKTFIPGEVPSTPEVPKEEQTPKTDCPYTRANYSYQVIIGCTSHELSFAVLSTTVALLPFVNSQTLEEVARLEKALKSGQLPADLKIGDDGMTNNEAAKEDKMVTDEQTEANDGAQEMLSLNRRIMNLQK